MPLSDIVNVVITENTVVPTRVGFGTPLILDFNQRFTDTLTRVYKSLTAMASDGFLTTDPAYKMAKAIFSQNPRVTQVRVGRTSTPPQQVINYTPNVKDSTTYTVKINSTTKTFTTGVGAAAATIVTGLIAAIGTTDGVTASSTGGGNILVLTGTAGVLFEASVTRSLLTQEDVTNDPGSVADLQAITTESDDFYTVHPTCHGDSIVLALAGYIETVKKILITEGSDDAELAGTGTAEDLKLLAYARTGFCYAAKAFEYMGAAWAGRILPQDPGSTTWKFKTLAGVTPSSFTDTELANLKAQNCNYYVTIAGINIMAEGVSSSGEFLDITQGSDWMAQRMAERIFSDLANNLKIPFTDPGIQIIESDVIAQIKEGIGTGFIAADPPFVVTVPKASEISTDDKNSRVLNGVEFSAPLAGAIHAVNITGTISV